jgi:hypothetical protein
MRKWIPYVGLSGQPLKTGYWKRVPDPAPGLERLLGRAHSEEQTPSAAHIDEAKQETETDAK